MLFVVVLFDYPEILMVIFGCACVRMCACVLVCLCVHCAVHEYHVSIAVRYIVIVIWLAKL